MSVDLQLIRALKGPRSQTVYFREGLRMSVDLQLIRALKELN